MHSHFLSVTWDMFFFFFFNFYCGLSGSDIAIFACYNPTNMSHCRKCILGGMWSKGALWSRVPHSPSTKHWMTMITLFSIFSISVVLSLINPLICLPIKVHYLQSMWEYLGRRQSSALRWCRRPAASQAPLSAFVLTRPVSSTLSSPVS